MTSYTSRHHACEWRNKPAVAVRMGTLLALLPSLASAAQAAASTTAHASANDPLSVGNVLSVLLGLVFVVALLLAAAWMIRRFQQVQAPREGVLQVTAQMSLGLKERVLLVRVGDENVLIGCTPGSIRPLHSWHGPNPDHSTDKIAAKSTATTSVNAAPDFMTQLRSVLVAQGLRKPGASS